MRLINPLLLILLSSSTMAIGDEPPVMWFQPGLWGQPASVPGIDPIDPPDDISPSNYLSALDQFLRPKPLSIIQTQQPLSKSNSIIDSRNKNSIINIDDPKMNPVMIWLSKWREWVKSEPGKEMPIINNNNDDDQISWWNERMKNIKNLYNKATKNDQDRIDKIDSNTRKDHTKNEIDDNSKKKPFITNVDKPNNKEDSPPSTDDEILLPSKEILNGLKCRPLISFQSCADHCMQVLPISNSAPSLTHDLIPKGRKLTIAGNDEIHKIMSSIVANLRHHHDDTVDSSDTVGTTTSTDHHHDHTNSAVFRNLLVDQDLNETAGQGGDRNPHLGNPDEWHHDGWEMWQVSQYKSCLFGVCVVDYLKRPVPGCLGPDGHLVPWTDSPRKIRNPDPTSAAEFDDFDFYDPKRLELWRGLGFYSLVRVWHELTGGTGAARLVFLPVVVLLALFALPAFVIALVLPIVSRLMASSGGMEEAALICDTGPFEEFWIKTAEPLVGVLSSLGQQGVRLIEQIGGYLSGWTNDMVRSTTIDRDEMNFEMVTSPSVPDVMRKKLVTHGEQRSSQDEASFSAGTIDTFIR